MNKGFVFKILGLLALTLSAEANIVRIIGNGSGGTTHGDREAACDRAYERAEDDAVNQCFRRDGDALDLSQGACHCRRKPGSRDDYACDATVRLNCEVACRPSEIQLSATGLGMDYNRAAACDDAIRRAEDENAYNCSRRGGFITFNNEVSSNSRRLNSGEYECRSTVQSSCELSTCR